MANKPRIRFKGFTEDWEQRKLGDFTNQINTFVNPEDAKLPLWSLTAEAGLIEKSDRYERDFLVKKKDQFKRIETNTLVYNPMNITIGSIDIYTGLYPIAVSGYYVSIVYDKNIDTDFLKEVLLLPSSLKMYKNYATGSLIERQRVQYPTFSKLQLLLPNLDEQKAIGQIFKSLNLNITLHQCKLEKLKLTKKALLQKLFPKNGKHIPEIRFKGFTDAWEQRKLSDILKVNSGKDYKHLDQGNIPVYGTGGYMLSVNESLSNIDAIGIGRKGTIDKPQYLKAPFWTVDTLFYLTALDKHSILFLYYLMQLIPWKKFDESTGVPSLSKTTIDNISGFVPSNFQEEELISALFNQLDKSITLHQRKLERLQEVKKGLLQKMFV